MGIARSTVALSVPIHSKRLFSTLKLYYDAQTRLPVETSSIAIV